MKHNQKGFSLVEALIIVLVVGLLGFGAWFIWQKNSDKKSSKDTSAQKASSSSSEEKKAADPTEDWVAYSNEIGDFSFKHPATWVYVSDTCSDGLVLFAPSAASLGKCATESGGQMQFSSIAGDERSNYQLSETYYKDATDEAVTVEAVAGNKLTATVSGMEAAVEVGGLPDNTKLVRYLFFTKGRTYIAGYVQQPTYPDALSDFNLLMTKTFKFSK